MLGAVAFFCECSAVEAWEHYCHLLFFVCVCLVRVGCLHLLHGDWFPSVPHRLQGICSGSKLGVLGRCRVNVNLSYIIQCVYVTVKRRTVYLSWSEGFFWVSCG